MLCGCCSICVRCLAESEGRNDVGVVASCLFCLFGLLLLIAVVLLVFMAAAEAGRNCIVF